jgi:NADH dehydrogenase
MKVTGFLAYVMWGFIHVLYLIGWGNRLGTLYTWLRALVFTKNRGHRIITFEQAHDQAQEHHAPSHAPSQAAVGPPTERPASPAPPPVGSPATQRAG